MMTLSGRGTHWNRRRDRQNPEAGSRRQAIINSLERLKNILWSWTKRLAKRDEVRRPTKKLFAFSFETFKKIFHPPIARYENLHEKNQKLL